MSVENALGIKIPDNARIIRNLMMANQLVQDHVSHFYHLHALDWVDVGSALKAAPAKTSVLQQTISDWPLLSPTYFKTVQNRRKNFVESEQLGIFANGYWGHSVYGLHPEAKPHGSCSYLEALEWQK